VEVSEVGHVCVDWICVLQDGAFVRALMNTSMKLRALTNILNLFIICNLYVFAAFVG
jgi:hypothetical protein